MKQITAFLEKYLVPFAGKLSKLKPLTAISRGFTALIPITIIGSIFTLLTSLQIGPYQTFISAIGIKEILGFAPKVTTDMISVYAVFLIAKALAEELDLDDKVATIVATLSLVSFLILIPLGVSGKTEAGEVYEVANALTTTYLGAPGLFTAIIVGLITPVIYNIFIKNNITLKMPSQVPDYISKSFSALIPAFAIAVFFGIIRFIFAHTEFLHVNNFIYTLLRMPLAKLTASPVTFIIFLLLCDVLWFFGMHGGLIVLPFLSMLYTPMNLENLAAYEAGAALPNAITGGTWTQFAMIGGAGAALGLCILLLFAKSERYKVLGKIALPAGICGINEPLLFGLPIVLNTILLIPFILAPIVTFLITYGVTLLGLVPYQNGVTVPMGTPVIISGFLSGGWQSAVLQIVLIAVQIAIYLPFFRVLDNQAYKEEQANTSAEAEVATA